MAEDNLSPESDGTRDRKFPVIGCVLVILLILALFAVIFFYGQFAAAPGNTGGNVGP